MGWLRRSIYSIIAFIEENMVPDMAMCTVMTSPNHIDTYIRTHTFTVLGTCMESPRVTDKWITHTHRGNRSQSHTHPQHTQATSIA